MPPPVDATPVRPLTCNATELLELLFLPGFTMKEEVTKISGITMMVPRNDEDNRPRAVPDPIASDRSL